ncbi:iron-siderophore ABC transporter substrate-binding protein [Frondihabitans australicus]|uniref:Iron complex transport system substrate-binding protein n=1 Tax=Frondihabitans australicus TaxID=386892 RepID=A0A495ICN8_9MICO|nr:iron-siderophore ABC transporter substrate-binding protein [Frondihabitans australicus]RKR73774.1 iron complex transport system substrate-binding protein [Frondihabitans australicus]
MFTPTALSKTARRIAAVAVAAGLVIGLAACSTPTSAGSSASSSSSTSGTDKGAFPVTIKSALGSATITKAPKRVVTIGWGSTDTAISLGVVPVGIEKQTFGNDSTGDYPWDTAAIKKMGGAIPATFNVYPDIDVSAIAALNPDLILAPQSGITAAQYKTLSALAPTVAYPGQPWQTKWDTQMRLIGKALGKTTLVNKQIADLKTTLANYSTKNPEFKGLTFAYVYSAQPGSLSIYQQGDPRVEVIKALGLTETPSIAALPASKDTFTSDIGLEKANLLDKTDILFTWFNDEANEKQIEAQPLFAQIPAVKRGSYVPNVDQKLAMASTFITPLSVPYALPRYVKMIKKAASNVG